MRLLLVEDDGPLASTMASSFQRQGWQVTVAREGLSALSCFQAQTFSVVVIDWVLPPPGPCGLELCEQMRQQSSTVGLVFATGREALGDRLLAFKAGADDYIVKPFEREELMARVAAVARRTEIQTPLAAAAAASTYRPQTASSVNDERYLSCGSIQVDMATLRVTVDHQEIDLSLRQLLILIYLMRRRGSLVSEAELREQVLRTASVVQTSTMRNHIHQLRDRLGAAKSLIYSVHGRGYGIGLPESAPAEVNDCATVRGT